jgi:hypothetical protein
LSFAIVARVLQEETKRGEHRVSFTEQKLIDRGLGWQVPKHDEVPSGRLTLIITNVSHMRHRFSESAKPLEQSASARKKPAGSPRRSSAGGKSRGESSGSSASRRCGGGIRSAGPVVADIRGAIGEVDSSSELGKWLAWASEHAEDADPLRQHPKAEWADSHALLPRLRYDRIAERGFRELTGYGSEKAKPGVELTCRPPRLTSWERALKLELPEDLLLPYEWAQASDWYWRTFLAPAALLNSVLALRARTRR